MSGLKLVARAPSLVAIALALHATTAAAQSAVDLDTVRAGRFDNGKMWTFEYPPATYFSETYGFVADTQWFERARMAALRIPGCSASFVSPHGLLATNHHCVRGAVVRVTRGGEALLDDGFYAVSLDEERPIPGYWADQLIAVEDVSDEVFAALDRAATLEERRNARRETAATIADRLRGRYGDVPDSIHVQIVDLYHGGRYSAYVFRRFTDVRLVAAAELQLGFFGGDADNFTYPRYALDFAFLRLYGRDGRPVEPPHHFTWSERGVEEGDAVFVIGNPGPTNRLATVAQLEFQRHVQVPAAVAFLRSRHEALAAFQAEAPAAAESLDVRNRMFSLSNSLKANTGRLAALGDPVIMTKRRDAGRALRDSIARSPELSRRFGDVIERLGRIQGEKARLAREYGAFYALGSTVASSATLRRALAAHAYLESRDGGAPPDSVAALRRRLLAIADQPAGLERRLLAARMADFARYLGPAHEVTRASGATHGEGPAGAAAALLSGSLLGDAQRTVQAVERGTLEATDPAVALATALLEHYGAFRSAFGRLTADEQELAGELGRARFAVYGRSVPPDATSSPRITDGVVRGYQYNGTVAPPYTTYFGMYDRFHAHGGGTDWDLPDPWRIPPADLALRTPLNFVSTADTYGGNSGSPAVTPRLELVGLNFDRNIEGLSRDFIYLPERGRNIMVDVRAIRAALDHVYDADRIVLELTTGRLYRSEAEADQAR